MTFKRLLEARTAHRELGVRFALTTLLSGLKWEFGVLRSAYSTPGMVLCQ